MVLFGMASLVNFEKTGRIIRHDGGNNRHTGEGIKIRYWENFWFKRGERSEGAGSAEGLIANYE
jgi:hypothetical protein